MPGVGELVAAAAMLSAVVASGKISETSQLDVTYGGIVLSGGWTGIEYLTTVETIETDFLPPLPERISDHTLTAVGSVLYNCGGYNNVYLDDCYTLNVSETELQWRHTLDLPTPMAHHTATAVGSHIWFIHNDYVYDLDTSTNLFQTYSTPFISPSNQKSACAVSFGSGYTFIVGVGAERNEVWVNTKESDPTEWERTVILKYSKQASSCLLHENKIFVTGGEISKQYVDIIDIFTNTVNSTSKLEFGREFHGSFVLDGQPAVAGGYGTDPLRSIEVFDEFTNKWNVIDLELSEAKDNFGYTQFPN